MDAVAVLTDAYGRILESVQEVVAGLTPDQLAHRVDPGANSIAWLVWHLTRVQDDHVSEVAGQPQVWSGQGWAERFALPLPVESTGYGHTSADVATVRVDSPELLSGYHAAVHRQTLDFFGKITDADLDRVVDRRWTPPVTLGVRLVSVADDDARHVGQAEFVRGIVLRRG